MTTTAYSVSAQQGKEVQAFSLYHSQANGFAFFDSLGKEYGPFESGEYATHVMDEVADAECEESRDAGYVEFPCGEFPA